MRCSTLSVLLLSSFALAEDLSYTLGYGALFESWNNLIRGPCLPMLEEIATNHPITILIPHNDAVEEFRNGPDFANYNNAKLCELVKYHAIMGTHNSEELVAAGPFLETFLGRSKGRAGAAIQAEQERAVDRRGRGVNFYSGLRRKASIWNGNYHADGTPIHAIDKVLTPPLSFADTAHAAGLTSAVMAATKVNLEWWGDDQATYFVPSNEAFRQVGSIMDSASDEELRDILAYHYLNATGAPLWTASMTTTNEATAGGKDLMMTLSKAGDFYVNTAKITQHNIITANGVLHIIDHVLNPENPQSKQENNSPFSLPAFENATASGSPPFAGMLTQKSRYHLEPGQAKGRIPMGYTDDDPIDTDYVDGVNGADVDSIS